MTLGAAGLPNTVVPGWTLSSTTLPMPTTASLPMVRLGTMRAPGYTAAPSPIFTLPPIEQSE